MSSTTEEQGTTHTEKNPLTMRSFMEQVKVLLYSHLQQTRTDGLTVSQIRRFTGTDKILVVLDHDPPNGSGTPQITLSKPDQFSRDFVVRTIETLDSILENTTA